MLLLIIGWPRHFASLLSALDARLPRHSTVVVLSERNEAWRKMEMEQEGLRLDGKALSRAAAEKQARSNAVPQTPKGKKRQTSAGHFRNATGCARLTLRHAYGRRPTSSHSRSWCPGRRTPAARRSGVGGARRRRL